MKTAIICSKTDEASVNIHSFLKERIKPRIGQHEVSLHLEDKDSIFLENIDEKTGCDFIIFATKHQSKSGVHSLSVHTQGNWGKAEMGGKDRELGVSPANWLKEAMKMLEDQAERLGYEAIQECTHHGPSIQVPSMFIEIGSGIEEWQNPKAGEAIADIIISLLEMNIPSCQTAVGIGGLHHTPNFKKIILNSSIAVGHVCPKYNLENLDREMLEQAMKKTDPKAALIIVDWKGLGEHKEKIKRILEEMNVQWKKTKDY